METSEVLTPLVIPLSDSACAHEMAQLIRAKDWNQHPLGPAANWSPSLHDALALMLNARCPMFLLWGGERSTFYNDGARALVGEKHPWALGEPGAQVWSDIWDALAPAVERVLRDGQAASVENVQLCIARDGGLEEVFFTFACSPVPGAFGGVGGMLCVCTETTRQVLSERRLRALRDLAAVATQPAVDIFQTAVDALVANSPDIPFARLYLLDAERKSVRRVASAGVDAAADGWPLLRVALSGVSERVELAPDRCGAPGQGRRPALPAGAMLLPIARGVLVLGVSGRRPFDDDYRIFCELIAGQISASSANAAQAAAPVSHESTDAMMRTLESIADGFLTMDREWRYTYLNAEAERLLRKSRTELLGKCIWEEYPVLKATDVESQLREVAATQTAREFEGFYRRWQRWYQHKAFPTPDGGIAIHFRDITERKQTENELRFQGMVLRQVSDAVVAIDNAHRITYLNHAAERDYGVKAADVLGRHLREIYEYRWLSLQDKTAAYEALRGTGTWRGENVNVRGDGAALHVEAVLNLLRDENGEPTGKLAVIRDITARRTAEQALRASERRFRELADAMPQFVWTAAPDGRITFVNRQWQLFSGLALEDMNDPAKLEGVVHPEDAAYVFDRWRQALATGEALEMQWRCKHRVDGAWRWCLARAVPVRDADGRIREWFGTATDIHEQKVAEERLRQSEQRFARFMQYLPGSAWLKDTAGRFVFVNDAAAKAWGRSPEELYGKTVADIFPADGAARCEVSDRCALQSDDSIQTLETYTDAQGAQRDLLCNKFTVPDTDGQPRLVGAIGIDVTEHRRAEELLRKSEERFAKAFNFSPLVQTLASFKTGRLMEVNDAFVRLSGYTREEAIGRTTEELGLWVNVADREQEITLLRGSGSVRNAEYRFRARDGRELIGRLSSERVDIRGEPCVLTLIEDITEHKAIENALHESEERFRALANNMSQFAWMADANGWIFWYNQRWYDYTGTTLEEMQGWGWRKAHHPDHVERVVRSIQHSWDTGEPWEEVFPLRGRDGSYRWFLARALPIRDEQGRVTRWFGTNTDITEQRELEAALRESEERFRNMADHAPGMVWVANPDGAVTFLSKSWYEYTGQRPETALGRGWFTAVHPRDRAQARIALRAAGERREPLRVDYRLRGKDGKARWFLNAAAPRYTSDGRFLGYVGYVMDITERKQAEERLRASESRLATKLEMMNRLHALSRQLLRAPDLKTALEEVLDATVLMQGTDMGAVQLIDPCTGRLECAAYRGLSQEFLEQHKAVSSEGDSVCARALRTRERFILEDIEADASFAAHAPLAAAAGFRAALATPLMSRDGTLLGMLTTHFREAHRPSDAELRMVDLYARHAADFIERFRIEQALRESEAGLRFALRGANAGAWRWNAVTGETFWSEEYWPLYGFDAAAPPAVERWLASLHPDDRERVAAEFQAHLESNETEFQKYYRILHPQRGLRWILDVGRTERDANGRAIASSGINLDVTERKQAEEALRESEERLRLAVLGAGMATWDTDVATGTIVWNRRHFDILGLSPETDTMTVETWQSRVHPDDLPLVREAREEALRTGGLYAVEPRIIRADDGAIRWLSAYGRFLYGANGNPSRFIGVCFDVTERKQAEEALRNSERLYRAIGESINYGVWVCDPEGRNVYASDTFLQLVGMTQAEFAGYGWARVLHPDEAESTTAAWRECVRSGGQWDRELRVLGVDGNWYTMLARGVPVRNERGEITAWAGINLDISRQKEVEDELREAHYRKDEFLATLAHELRNPLAPLRNGLEIMRLAKDNRDSAERARAMMERQLQQMVRLIDDLLDLSRITRGKVELRRERVDLAVILQQAVETSRPLIEQLGHELSIRVPRVPLHVDGDETRLAQVVANLLNNAAKYTEKNGRIALAVERRGREAWVRVKDNGRGIPAHMLAHVFEMFTQVERLSENPNSGLGIGLSIVRRLVEMHGGRVEARSDGPGMGSEFIVRLPALAAQTGAAPAPADEPVSHDTAAGRRILVADDNADAAASLAMMLKIMGNDVRTARDGIEAVKIAQVFRPELILLDIGMPKLDGYGTCRRIREQPWGRDIVIAALTGWGQEEDKRQARDAGFDQHLVKPVEPAALERLLGALRVNAKEEVRET